MDNSFGFTLLLSAVVINFSINDATSASTTPTPITCSLSEFKCNDGSCIPNFSVCDDTQDCPGNEDEFNCYYTTYATSTTEFESVFVSSAYNFSSPNYPADYPNNLRFTWYFSTKIGMQLALTFTAINTELNYDYIIVRDGSESFIGELLLEWSGSGPGNEVKVVSSENVMSVTFETDRSITTTGFAALLEVTSFTRDELDCGHRFDCINGVCLPYERVCDNVNECGNGADEDSGNCPDVTDSTSLTPATESEYISIASVHYFSSPNYPVEYPNSLLYTWYFSTNPGSRLLLTFIDIKTENNYDYITVRDGNASFSGELLLRLSGEVSPNEVRVLSSQNDMLVIFETDTNVQEDGFAALVVVTCLTTAELDCEEEFDCNNGACLPKDRACNGQDDCGNDADESNDYCSVDLVTEEVSTNFPEVTSFDYLSKEVSTDSEISPSTFYAGKTTYSPTIDAGKTTYSPTIDAGKTTYSPTIDAGKTTYSPTIEHTVVFVDPAYYFASPNYPRNYPKDLWYTWHISTFPGMRILLTFFEINTEYSYDFVSVREGNTSLSGELLFRMSGVALPHEVKVLSLENGLVVTLETDRSVTSNGFAVVAEIASGDSLDCVQQFNCGNGVCLPQSRLCDGQEECGNGADENHLCKDTTSRKGPRLSQSDFFFVNLTRYFESPNYPANYPKNLNYTWYLSTLPGLQLLLTFFNVSTEYNYDYISVRDGNTSFNGELLLQWSGVSLLDDVRVLSRGNDLIVTFESDRSVTRRGFTFLVETTSSVRDGFDCGQEFNCENGVCLSRSRLCDGYEECGNGADENNDNCIDTITTASPPLAQSEFAFINRSYYFTSPNHPFDYPKNIRYTWYLSTSPGLQLVLTFFEVNTEYSYDFISVREGNVSFNGEVLLRWSGECRPREVKVLSAGNDVSLTFDTDESVTSEGFTVFVETTSSTKDGIDCGQQFNCGNGVCLPQTRLCDGQQECGNGADEHYDYCLDFSSNDKTTVVPNIAPIINCPTPTSFLQSNENKVVSRIDGTCIDVEDGPLSLACNETQNSLQAGDNYIGCSCIDASGSIAECVFIVNVPGADLTTSNDMTTPVSNIAPIINCPTPTSFLQSNENKAVTWIDGTCIDVEDGPLSFICNETQNSLQAGDNYIGCSCIDASGSVAECVFIVNVPGADFTTKEMTALVLPTVVNCPQTSIMETVIFGTTSATVFWTEPNAASNTGGFISVFRSHSPGDRFPVGETTVAYIFTDNPSQVTNICAFLVIVQIGDAPPFPPVCPSLSTFMSLAGNIGNFISWTIGDCFDPEDASITPECRPPSGAFFVVGTHPVVCTCTNSAGLSSDCSFYVTVNEDNTAPFTPICPSISPVISLSGNIGNFVSWNIGMCFDAQDGNITPVCNPMSNSFFYVGSTPVVCTCTDSAGLSSECSFNAIVNEETLPISICPNGTPTPHYTTSCLCNPGFGGNNCGKNTTLSGPIRCPSNGITTLGAAATYPEPSGVPTGVELLYTTFQSGSNDLPLGDNELFLVYGNDLETYVCQFTITVTDRLPDMD